MERKITYNMFKTNNQPGLFSFEDELSKKQRNALDGSKEKWFYHLVLRNINEVDFRALYSDKASRQNAPVNILVSALILKELKGISYDELMESEIEKKIEQTGQSPDVYNVLSKKSYPHQPKTAIKSVLT